MSLDVFRQANQNVRGNGFVYTTDLSKYGRLEFWALLDARREGDCEDFALTQMEEYLQLGGDRDSICLALVATEMAKKNQIIDHAVCAYIQDGKVTHFTDNRYINTGVMPTSDVRYKWHSIVTPDILKHRQPAKLLD